MSKCRFKGCDRKARKGFVMCSRHSSAGGSVAQDKRKKFAAAVEDKLAERGISREWMKKHLIIDRA